MERCAGLTFSTFCHRKAGGGGLGGKGESRGKCRMKNGRLILDETEYGERVSHRKKRGVLPREGKIDSQ